MVCGEGVCERERDTKNSLIEDSRPTHSLTLSTFTLSHTVMFEGHILLTVSDSLNPFTVYGLDPRAPTVLYRVVMQVAHKAPFGAAVGPV